MIPDRLLLAREGAGALHQGLGHLVVVDLDANLLADFGKEEAQADASLGDAPIIGARLVFCRVLVGKALAGLLLIASTCFQIPWNSCSTRPAGSSNEYFRS